MFKISRYLVLAVLGLILGLGLLWLTGNSHSSANSTPVIAGPSTNSNPASNSTTTPTTVQGASFTPPAPLKAVTPVGIGSEYLALGDSVAYGIGAPSPNEQGYAGIFYANYLKRVQPNLADYRNLAVPGETSASFLSPAKGRSQLLMAEEELTAATKAGRKVSPVTLTLGGNDMLNARGKSEAEHQAILATFETNYSRILDDLKSKLGGADLIVTTYYNPYAYQTGQQDPESIWLQRFNEVIRKRGTESGAKIADFSLAIAGQERALTWIGSGDVHPNEAGHSVLAQSVWKASGYDRQPPVLGLVYSPQGPANKVASNSRLVFKLSVQDEWTAEALKFTSDLDTAGAGSLTSVTVSLDDGSQITLSAVPARYSNLPAGPRLYSFVLDSSGLLSGKHFLRFQASDAAGNQGSLEVNFEIS